MIKFLAACRQAKVHHGIMFKHFTCATRRNIVRYWMPTYKEILYHVGGVS